MSKDISRQLVSVLSVATVLWALMVSAVWGMPAVPEDGQHPASAVMADCESHDAKFTGDHCQGESCQCLSDCHLPAFLQPAIGDIPVRSLPAVAILDFLQPLVGRHSPPYRPPTA